MTDSAASVLAGAQAPTTGAEAVTDKAAAPVAEAKTEAPAGDWRDGLTPDLKSVVEAKKWADPKAVVEGYKNLEKLLGGDKVALPKEADDPAWGDVWKRLGAMESAQDYAAAVKPVEGAPAIDPAFVEAMAPIAKDANLTAAQWAKLVEGYQATAAKMVAAQPDQEAAFQRAQESDIAALKTEWAGPKWDANVAAAQRAVTAAGIEPDQVAAIERAIGTKATLSLFAGLGSKFGVEINYVDGKPAANGLTPEAARVRIRELQADTAWAKRYATGGTGSPEFKEMMRLQEAAALQ